VFSNRTLCLDVAEMGDLVVQWKKSFKTDDKIPRSEGQKTLALSAFMLTSQPTPLARKAIVMEMWESGAHTIVCSCLILTAYFFNRFFFPF
jgi:hypothetical protein